MRCEVAKFEGVWQADRRNFKVRRIYTRKKCKANTFCLNKLWSNAEAMGKGKSSRSGKTRRVEPPASCLALECKFVVFTMTTTAAHYFCRKHEINCKLHRFYDPYVFVFFFN